MTVTRDDAPVREEGPVLGQPSSVLVTGLRVPQVRWAAAALALFLLGWGCQLVGAPSGLWWGLYLGCYGAGGWGSAVDGLRALREGRLDVDLLMIVAAVAAAAIGQVFDGALLIVIFATSGGLETIVTQRTAESVTSLLRLAPESATLIGTDGAQRDVATDQLAVGDVILVRPGERIGADGTVVEGVSDVDQQTVTGESVPVVRRVGDEVLSGTVNGTGMLRVHVDRPASASVIARIVTMVEQASSTKAQRQLFIEKVEQRYSVGMVAATLGVFALPLVAFSVPLDDALVRAITFMIVASPCALMLSTMPPLLAAIASAGRQGVLVKSATVMEQLGRVTLAAFDKTGTLTEGAPQVREVIPRTSTATADECLALAAAVERFSEHPLGRAIVGAAEQRQLTIPDAQDFHSQPGVGVSACVHGQAITVTRGVADPTTVGTVVSLGADDRVLATITLVDRIRPTASHAVAAMAALTGDRTHLLTGDNEHAARDVADHTGVDVVHAGLLPDDKAGIVADMEAADARVLLVGDGVNDAPALAQATVGVAMGRTGADLALESADVVVVGDDLAAIPALVAVARRAHRFVVANLTIAAAIIAVLVTWDLSATLPLPLAVAGHEGSTVVVALNGLRLVRPRAWTG